MKYTTEKLPTHLRLGPSAFLLAAMLLCHSIAFAATMASRAELAARAGANTLTLDFPAAPDNCKAFSLSNPERLVIDLQGVKASPALARLTKRAPTKDSGIAAIRIGHPAAGTTRIVLDLSTASPSPPEVRTSPLGKHGQRLLVQWGKRTPAEPVRQDTADAQQELTAGEAAYAAGKYPEAAEHYRRAADQGLAPAEFNLGTLYDLGLGVAQDYRQALLWYGKAAEHGHEKAQNNLGFMYSQGKGVTADYVAAHKWFNISGIRGYEEGRKNRTFLERLMTPEQIAEAQQQAGTWLKAHP